MTDRPTDKDTAEVVAWRKGWNDAYYFPDRLGGQTHCFRPKDDYDAEYVLDPRSDTDAALELLHHILGEKHLYHNNIAPGIARTRTSWVFYTEQENLDHEAFIPLSGSAFRNAVVRLAVEVKNQGTT